jgi:hypothetical protein
VVNEMGFTSLNEFYADVRKTIELIRKSGYSKSADDFDIAYGQSMGTEILLGLRHEAKKLLKKDGISPEIDAKLKLYVEYIEKIVTGIDFND